MKSLGNRILAVMAIAVLGWIALLGAASSAPVLQPDKLIILSTTDVRGKTSPCG